MSGKKHLRLIRCTKVQPATVPPPTREDLWNHVAHHGLHLSGLRSVESAKPLLDRANSLQGAPGVVLEFPKRRLGDTERDGAPTARAGDRRDTGAKVLHMQFDWRHDTDIRADNCACQQPSQNNEVEVGSLRSYVLLMTTNPRLLLKDWMDAHKISTRGWTKAAGLTENTLRGYLNNKSDSLTVANTRKLAKAIGVPFSILVEYTGGDVENARVPVLPDPAPGSTDDEESMQAIRAIASAASGSKR